MNDMEHRWGQRKSLDLAVRVRLGEPKVIEGHMRNVSLSGAYVEARELPPAFAQVSVEPLWAPPYVSCSTARRRNRLSLKAHVVRRDARGFALEWVDFAARTLQRLLRSSARLALEHDRNADALSQLTELESGSVLRVSVAPPGWVPQPCRAGGGLANLPLVKRKA